MEKLKESYLEHATAIIPFLMLLVVADFIVLFNLQTTSVTGLIFSEESFVTMVTTGFTLWTIVEKIKYRHA